MLPRYGPGPAGCARPRTAASRPCRRPGAPSRGGPPARKRPGIGTGRGWPLLGSGPTVAPLATAGGQARLLRGDPGPGGRSGSRGCRSGRSYPSRYVPAGLCWGSCTWNDKLSLIGTPEGCIAIAGAQPQNRAPARRAGHADAVLHDTETHSGRPRRTSCHYRRPEAHRCLGTRTASTASCSRITWLVT